MALRWFYPTKKNQPQPGSKETIERIENVTERLERLVEKIEKQLKEKNDRSA